MNFEAIEKESPRKELFYRVVTRTILVFLTIFIASVVPFFGDFLSLISALSTVLTAFVFPPVFYYVLTTRYATRPPTFELVFMAVVVIVGVLSCVAGVYYAVLALIDDFENGGDPFENFFTD